MRLFSRKPTQKSKPSEDAFIKRRQFSLPYDPSTIVQLIAAGAEGVERLEEAPIVETIYFSRLDQSRVIITAGNRLTTLWNIIIELQYDGSVTKGVIYVDRPSGQVKKWIGNVVRIFPGIHASLKSAGAIFTDWTYDDIFPKTSLG